MGSRLADGLALIALSLATAAAVVACADDEAPSTSTFTPTPPEVQTSPPYHGETDPSCTSHATDIRRDEPPSGACTVEGAECTFRTANSAEACSVPDASFGPSRPNEWSCTCTNAEWRCEITSGSFGASPCSR